MNELLDFIDEAALAQGPLKAETFVDELVPEGGNHDRFVYDEYDWTAPGFDPDYAVVRLGGDALNRRISPHAGKFFAVVSKARFRLPGIGDVRWYPLVEYWRDNHGEKLDNIKRVSAHRRIGPRKEGTVVYLHRAITGAMGKHNLVDHRGLGPLDNRDEALSVANSIINNYTAKRKRHVHRELMLGVEWTDHRRSIRVKRVCGAIRINGKMVRSKETWPLEEQYLAHAWYIARRDELIASLSEACNWSNPTKPPPPLIFPPLKKRFYTVTLSPELQESEEIPF
jgi:hypothetical protein